jgi:hypothetical protein
MGLSVYFVKEHDAAFSARVITPKACIAPFEK